MPDSFNFAGFIARWLTATFLVMAAYNPSGYSYVHWVFYMSGSWIWKILVGLALAIIYATFALATLRSLGRLGIAVWTALFLAVVWLLVDLDIIHTLNTATIAMIVLLVAANVLAVGVSWSYLRARLSGQADTVNVTLP
jgi:hypothetical protein